MTAPTATEPAPVASPTAAPSTTSATIERAERTLSNVETFEQQWKKFNDMFADLNRALVENLSRTFSGGCCGGDESSVSDADRKAVFGGAPPSLQRVAAGLAAGRYKHVVVCCGAGISTSAGIPDFRSPGTGLYAKLREEQLKAEAKQAAAGGTAAADGNSTTTTPPLPTRVEEAFSIDYFGSNPRPFTEKCAELWPSVVSTRYAPTPAHALFRVLNEAGVLLRVYTQNIDSLELAAGLPPHKVLQCHGHLNSLRCSVCADGAASNRGDAASKARYAAAVAHLATGEPLPCTACHKGYIRPDVVMFGESLPRDFNRYLDADADTCDLLLVLGTSLAVHPFASIPSRVRPTVPRVLMNRDAVGPFEGLDAATNFRNVAALGDIDLLCAALAEGAGLRPKLDAVCAELKCKRQLPAGKKAAAPPPRGRSKSLTRGPTTTGGEQQRTASSGRGPAAAAASGRSRSTAKLPCVARRPSVPRGSKAVAPPPAPTTLPRRSK